MKSADPCCSHCFPAFLSHEMTSIFLTLVGGCGMMMAREGKKKTRQKSRSTHSHLLTHTRKRPNARERTNMTRSRAVRSRRARAARLPSDVDDTTADAAPTSDAATPPRPVGVQQEAVVVGEATAAGRSLDEQQLLAEEQQQRVCGTSINRTRTTSGGGGINNSDDNDDNGDDDDERAAADNPPSSGPRTSSRRFSTSAAASSAAASTIIRSWLSRRHLAATSRLPLDGPKPRLRADVLTLYFALDHALRWFLGLHLTWLLFWVGWLNASLSPRALGHVHATAKTAAATTTTTAGCARANVVAAAAVALRVTRLLCSRLAGLSPALKIIHFYSLISTFLI